MPPPLGVTKEKSFSDRKPGEGSPREALVKLGSPSPPLYEIHSSLGTVLCRSGFGTLGEWVGGRGWKAQHCCC